MKVKALAILSALLLLTVPLIAKLPPNLDSVTVLQGPDCTTWSVNESKGLWVTAAHCVVNIGIVEDTGDSFIETWPLAIHGKPVTILKYSPLEEYDIALLQSDVHTPALKLGKYPQVGDQVTVYGFPGRFNSPFPTWLRVSNPYQKWADDQRVPWIANMVFDGNVWPGHSGSPVLDRQGKVVSLVQGFHKHMIGLSLGIPWSILRSFLVDAWERG